MTISIDQPWKRSFAVRGNANGSNHQRALDKHGIGTCESARVMIQAAPKIEEPRSLKLVKFPITELVLEGEDRETFTKQSRGVLLPRTRDLGLEAFPARMSTKLRLMYHDQPEDELLWVIMELILYKGFPHGFALIHDRAGLWLGTYQGFRPIGRAKIQVVAAVAA